MNIANALGLTNEQLVEMTKRNKNSFTVKYVERELNRKLTDEEIRSATLDYEISKRLNIGNTENLRKCGIEVSK